MHMQPDGNTVLMTGGATGIGGGLAESFHRRGNRVDIAGRRLSLPDEVTAARPAVESAVLDVENPDGVAAFGKEIAKRFPPTKAAIHSCSQSLRWQLNDMPADVIEIVAPHVATDLMRGASDARAMLLGEFIREVVSILQTQPDTTGICVERVTRLRFAERNGNYDSVFRGLNQAMKAGDL